MTQMADEIREIPEAIDRLLNRGTRAIETAATLVSRAKPQWVSIVARGTSGHAAVYARYLIETRLGIPVSLTAPSTLGIYGARISWEGGLVIAISQSGQSPDLLAAVEAATRAGAGAIAICNDAESPLAAACETVVECHAGPELSVAATKSYVTSLLAVTWLVAQLDTTPGYTLASLPGVASRAIVAGRSWIERGDVVDAFAAAAGALVLGRGYNLSTVLEVALKLIETSRLLAIGYSAADFEHGPSVLAGRGVPILAFESPTPIGSLLASSLARITEAGGEPWTVSHRGIRDTHQGDYHTLILPDSVPDEISPIVYAIPGLMLAEAVARRLGLDPDAPTGLSKVTLTR